jgi:hypothetical protein
VPIRGRGWILVAGLIAIAVIGTVIATRFSGPKLDAAGMAGYLPQREAAVFFMDVATVRDSGILEKLVGSAVGAEEAEYKQFLEQSGFDYKRDLDRVMINSANDTHYLLVDGRFDWDKLKAYAKGQGGSCEGDFCTVSGSTPGRIITFRPIAKNLMALASSANNKAAQDISPRTPDKPAFEVADKPVWLHLPASVLQNQTALPAGTRLFTRALENSQRIMFSLGPQGDKFELSMDVLCRTTEEAAVLKAQLEGVTKLLQSLIAREKQTPSMRDLSGVLTSGSFERNSEHVVGKWPIDRGFIDSLAAER